ncbi:oxidoreductase [Pseudooceanicola sp. MF1-13]|uniref:oxidoreductase n=1 Tax=Pseudooceanicola sp. MF1-13 TaxID=3379095 RepID=UPI003891DBF3
MIAILSLFALPALADELPTKPDPTPILTVETDTGSYHLTRETIAKLPSHSFTTSTIWTDGPQEFVGIRVADLLNLLDKDATTLQLTAANGYQIDVQAAHFHDFDAIIAYLRNGEPMTLRDKGPLWIVYPYDSDPRYKAEIIFANSIWQLERIELKH